MVNTKKGSFDYLEGTRLSSGKLRFEFRDITVGRYIINVGIPSRFGITYVTEIYRIDDGILLILNGEEIVVKFETIVDTTYYSFYAKRVLCIISLFVW